MNHDGYHPDITVTKQRANKYGTVSKTRKLEEHTYPSKGEPFHRAIRVAKEMGHKVTYGTMTKKWHVIAPGDRDYHTSFAVDPTTAERHGEEAARRVSVSPRQLEESEQLDELSDAAKNFVHHREEHWKHAKLNRHAEDRTAAKFHSNEMQGHFHKMTPSEKYRAHTGSWVSSASKRLGGGSAKEDKEYVHESEQLSELKSTTLRSYLDKRRPDDMEGPDTLKSKNWKGIDTAVKKLKSRNVPVHEESSHTLKTVKAVLAESATREHFRRVAEVIKRISDTKERQEIADHNAALFAKDNPKFDHAKFHAAAGTVHKKD